MGTEKPDQHRPKPPQVQENWLAMIAGKPQVGLAEYPLLSDAHVTGQFSAGPYTLINTAPVPEERIVKPTIVLRIAEHLAPESPSFKKTDAALYHGGAFPEEVASLMSLALGIRVRAGMASRIFLMDDPKGQPISWGRRQYQTEIIDKSRQGWVLPRVAQGPHSLSDLERIFNIPHLPFDTCIVLLRAARMYQEALWISESAPSLSWLLLVSAVETAASHFGVQKSDALTSLKDWNPNLYRTLESCEQSTLQTVAEQLRQISGSTRKFLDFMMHFKPAESADRPPEQFQIAWTDTNLRGALNKIYNYRSKALHDGTPFPFPMCEPPIKLEAHWKAPSEKPLGSVSALGAVWVEDDLPMLLHTFEYIARNALVKWWQQSLQLDKVSGL